MDNPKDLKYTKDHEWARIDGDIATVGITAFAAEQLTDVVFVELPEVGKYATQGKPIAVVESVKSVSDVFAPLSGEIIEINEPLKNSPETVNNSPFEDGWFLKIKIENPEEANNLMDADDYTKFCKQAHH